MRRSTFMLTCSVVLGIGLMFGGIPGLASEPDLEGLWYGYGGAQGLGNGTIEITFSDGSFEPQAHSTIPSLGLFDAVIPATIEDSPEGTTVTIVVPGLLELSGLVDGDTIIGELTVVYGGESYSGDWFAGRYTGEHVFPGGSPPTECPGLPPAYCGGTADHCSELMPFLPETGVGYINYPLNGEAWDDQYRSFLRRDLIQLVQYAAAKVDCVTAGWDYGNLEPIGLGDMSEADGSIPGTSTGSPGHPPGTHTDGKDVDIAYFQLYAPDNHLRSVGVHYSGPFQDASHLLGPPHALDVWRTALFVAYLSEHPRVRVIGVDGKIGSILEDAFDTLVSYSWIEYELRQSITLIYEEEDMGWGFFLFHHHHMHISTSPAVDVVSVADVKPNTLDRGSTDGWVTVHIELDEGLEAAHIDVESVALIFDGLTMLYAEPASAEIADYNQNGILDLTVKVDRQAVTESISLGTVEVTIVGRVDEVFFQETDTIRVMEGMHNDAFENR